VEDQLPASAGRQRDTQRRGTYITQATVYASFLLYAGLVVALVGAISLIKPLRFLWIRSRKAGAVVAAAGLLLAAIALMLPVTEHRSTTASARIDEFMPVWQFDERHETYVDASPERVFDAIKTVRADEILLFRTLTTMRRFGRPAPESILNAPDTKPILDVATAGGFVYLAQDAPKEIVVGTVVMAPRGTRGKLTAERFRQPFGPGFALATMNFAVVPEGAGSRVTTETRVFATDPGAQRGFSIYWRIIYPGSAMIRRMWLRAIQRRAESA
jgi:hypothetical protein